MSQKFIKSQNKNSSSQAFGKYFAQAVYDNHFVGTEELADFIQRQASVKKSDINVSQSWCVNVSQEGDYYVFTPMSYNSTLANGQSTEFGMIGRGQVGSSISYTVE